MKTSTRPKPAWTLPAPVFATARTAEAALSAGPLLSALSRGSNSVRRAARARAGFARPGVLSRRPTSVPVGMASSTSPSTPARPNSEATGFGSVAPRGRDEGRVTSWEP